MSRFSISYQPFDGDADSWNSLTIDAEDASFLQTWEFGEAKSKTSLWRVERGVLVERGSLIGTVQSMIRKPFFSKSGLVWINRGPVGVKGNYGEALHALTRQFCNERQMYLRVAPSRLAGELSFLECKASGLSKTNMLGWASSVVDLTKDRKHLRQNLNGKWRNALTRAERAEIEISISADSSSFRRFLRGHAHHLQKFGPKGGLEIEFLLSLQNILPIHRRFMCVAAHKDGDYLGGALIVKHGKLAEYLAGHNLVKGRSINAGQLILWKAMMHLKETGAKKFDLGGMDENLSPPGIFRFKKRIGGIPYRLAHEMEGPAHGIVSKIIRWRVNVLRSRG